MDGIDDDAVPPAVTAALASRGLSAIRVLGRGAFGLALLVATASGERYVVKAVDTRGLGERERRAARGEVEVLRRLSHPNIVAYEGSYTAGSFLLIVLVWGAFMAGLRAGTAHSTFPDMSGYWIPPGLLDLSPWWINFFENGTTIQFVHRWLAKLLVLGVLVMAWRAPRSETLAAATMAFVQLGLGIATILSGVSIRQAPCFS